MSECWAACQHLAQPPGAELAVWLASGWEDEAGPPGCLAARALEVLLPSPWQLLCAHCSLAGQPVLASVLSELPVPRLHAWCPVQSPGGQEGCCNPEGGFSGSERTPHSPHTCVARSPLQLEVGCGYFLGPRVLLHRRSVQVPPGPGVSSDGSAIGDSDACSPERRLSLSWFELSGHPRCLTSRGRFWPAQLKWGTI